MVKQALCATCLALRSTALGSSGDNTIVVFPAEHESITHQPGAAVRKKIDNEDKNVHDEKKTHSHAIKPVNEKHGLKQLTV